MRCLSGVLMKRPLLLLCLVVCASTFVSCCDVPADDREPSPPSKCSSASPSSESSPPSPPPPPPPSSPPFCRVRADYSSTEGELRAAIFAANTDRAAKILSRDETFGLGEGLRYLPGQECAVVKTENRRCDPDIVAYQAIASSVESGSDVDRLANAIVISFEVDCECSLFSSTERDRMKRAFRDVLKNPEAIQEILEFGDPVEDSKTCPSRLLSSSLEHRRMMSVSRGRRLHTGGGESGTDSFVCAFCDPPRGCNGVVNWCENKRG